MNRDQSGQESEANRTADANPSGAEVDIAATESFKSKVGIIQSDDCLLEACLERLAESGPVDDPGQLRSFLPDTDSDLINFILLELIKLDMALRADAGNTPRLDSYFPCFTDMISVDSIPVDLVLEEIQLRKEAGETPGREEYLRRFPQFETLIQHLLEPCEATASVGPLRKPSDLMIGSLLDDFRILQKLGEGAFARVFLANQISMNRLVALKISAGTGDEPRALAQLDHPNIVRVYDQRDLAEPQSHLLYMQYQPGGTLSDAVKLVRSRTDSNRNGTILLDAVDQSMLQAAQAVPDRSAVRDWVGSTPWPVVVAWIGVQLANALGEAHRLGMLHRDVKPANVLLTAEGIPKLADFNVSFAGAAGRAGAAVSMGGSIAYMSPEHLRGITAHALQAREKVDCKSDLYSLAILLWELWQGQRPFPTDPNASSWSALVAQQIKSRYAPPTDPERCGSPSERVLEKTLRIALSDDPAKRPAGAAEMAGRLKLALHPEVAALIDPPEQSGRSRIAARSPWLVAGIIILIPNIAAGILNFEYNMEEIKMTNEMRFSLSQLAAWVNSILYPLGVALMLIYTNALARAIRGTRSGQRVTDRQLDDTLNLGHRAAIIGGTCWIAAGIVYTTVLTSMFDGFQAIQATHFFLSMLICGGVAMVYPMFGLAVLATLVYYPLLIRGTMQDDHFDRRRHRLIRQCESYLLIAAIIPLLGAAILTSTNESGAGGFTLTAIVAGIMGLLASFFAYRLISKTWNRFGEVLSKKTSLFPGDSYQ